MGRPKKIKTPDLLWDYAIQYFDHVNNSPIYINEMIKSGEHAGKIIPVPHIKPYTWEGFSTWLWDNDIIGDIDDYKQNKNGAYDEYSGTIARIRAKMFDQKVSGASCGAYNPSIIARELGLTDKKEIDVKSEQPLFGDSK